MALTDVQIRKAKPQAKRYKLGDGRGLFLLVSPSGGKWWRLKYVFEGRERQLSLGTYPDVGLAAARERREQARQLLADGIDPAEDRAQEAETPTLESVAREWWEHQSGTWTKDHAHRVWVRLRDNALIPVGRRPITDIKPQDVIALARKIESRGALDVAGRVLQDVRRVCRYAVQTGRLVHNPASDLTGVLKGRKTGHRASLPREELPGFLLALEQYQEKGRALTRLAIELLVMTFVRPGELRGARWDEFDLDGKLWRIPGERMKMGTDHLVPLSRQAIAVLGRIEAITGGYDLLFPSERNRQEPMSDNTMRRAIFRLGYDGHTEGKSKCVPHGFRATASSILNESGFNPDAIERQLAHMERNGVRAAYIHHARYLDDRRQMMQWWADYLDALREQAKSPKVVAGTFRKATG